MSAVGDLRARIRGIGWRPVGGLLAWVYIYLVAQLLFWVAMTVAATGWTPIVITTGSMQPTLRPGDVVLVADHPVDELVSQNSVITFESADGSLVTHRVLAVDSGRYITKGDANPTPDTMPVEPDAVRSVGRLVVPFLGLPVVWAETGDVASLAALGVLTAGALAVAILGARLSWRRRTTRSDRAPGVAGGAIRRVRVLVGVMIIGQYFLDPDRFRGDGIGTEPWQLLAIALSLLAAINAASSYAARTGDAALIDRMSVMELAGDTLMVVLLATATGTSGIGWVLFALPIVEAAARFRLTGALVHWMGLTGVTLVTRIWVLERAATGSNAMITELEQVLDQLSVLLLVVIPGAHLVEQLLGDVVQHRRATSSAIERGRLLEYVAEVGKEVNRLSAELFTTMADAVLRLGFDEADVCAMSPDGSWKVLASAVGSGRTPTLVAPGLPGSTLRPDDLLVHEACIDHLDDDAEDWLPVAGAGMRTVLRFLLSSADGTVIALRAGVSEDRELHAGTIDAMRLLAGQAAVALQNDRLINELHEAQAELEQQARHDALTGLPNRLHFIESLDKALAEADDPAHRHAVLFLDLDGFKPVNDKFGHAAGDTLLRFVGERLSNIVGDDGVVARLGGDEFTALIEERIGSGRVESMVREIQRRMTEPYRIGDDTADVGVSVGLTYSEAGVSGSELLRRADAAMYSVKGSGGDLVSVANYSGELDAADRRRARLASELSKAIAADDLSIVYQPIAAVDGGWLAGVEALIRWQHRDMGAVSPATILELAEAGDLVVKLNEWIMRRVGVDVAGWGLPAEGDFFVAVNVTPRELGSDALFAHVRNTLSISGLRPENLVIELSERIAGPDRKFLTNLDRLRELGVRIALDDFGEGQTSLAHLSDLPISMLKVDRRIVQQAARTTDDHVILETVVRLATQLGFSVVAEGVETDEQFDAVVSTGCHFVQGFLLSVPRPSDEIAVLLSRPDAIAGRSTSVADATETFR